MAWSLASRGVRVGVVDRARFPREKVCGDFIEPRGLRLFGAMGCLSHLEANTPLPITHAALYLQSRCAYRGPIPFYGAQHDLPNYGYIVPREELDHTLLRCAEQAGATVQQECALTGVERQGGRSVLRVRRGARETTLRCRLLVGADGAHSAVARSAGLLRADPRYMAVSQRAYAEGVELDRGEATFVFDRELFPGYGWLFPMSNGRANVGVGILAEVRERDGINVRGLFEAFIEKLRATHPACGRIQVASKVLGGIVKTFGGAGPNYFEGGILIGDAGCFVDPMTGEGITPAAESALLGAAVLSEALERGRTDRAFLARYQHAFRAYFDPAMGYLDFCACLLRNRHLSECWLRAVTQGCQMAAQDDAFATVTGATFGGMAIQPLSIALQLWTRSAREVVVQGVGIFRELLAGTTGSARAAAADWMSWQVGLGRSFLDDPRWHVAWAADVTRKWLRLPTTWRTHDPRSRGPLLSALAS